MGIRGETQTNYRWLVLGVGVLAQMATSISFFPGLATIAPLLAGSYRMSLFQTGLLFSGMQLGPVLTMALWGVNGSSNRQQHWRWPVMHLSCWLLTHPHLFLNRRFAHTRK